MNEGTAPFSARLKARAMDLGPTEITDDQAPAWDVAPEPVTELRGLAKRLFEKPFEFDFFQAVRLLHLIDPTRVSIGRGGPPSSEAVRFRALNSLSFPPSSVYDLERPTAARAGPRPDRDVLRADRPERRLAPPLHRTPDAAGPRREGARTARPARLVRPVQPPPDLALLPGLGEVSVLRRLRPGRGRAPRVEPVRPGRAEPGGPRASAVAQPAAGRRRGRHDPRGAAVLARVDDLAIIHFAGLFAHHPRSAEGLQALASDYLRSPAEVRQFHGQWLRLEPANQTRLGGASGGQRLGVSTVVGERVWDVQSKVRLRLGPLAYHEFQELLPDRAPVPRGRRSSCSATWSGFTSAPASTSTSSSSSRPTRSPSTASATSRASGPGSAGTSGSAAGPSAATPTTRRSTPKRSAPSTPTTRATKVDVQTNTWFGGRL